MGMHDREPLVADVTGLPTFYVTDVVREDAGNGNARIWNCTVRSGILIPQCEIIIPAQRLFLIGHAASEFAAQIYRRHQVTMFEEASSRH